MNDYWKKFLISGLGYMAGALFGFLFIVLVSWMGLAGWLFSLINQNQSLIQILGITLIAGILLALGGAITGGIGGWTLLRVLNFPKRTQTNTGRTQTIAGSAIAFAVSTGLLILVFLLLVSFIGLYNNFNRNQVEHYGIIFGLFGFLFGLVTGILQALLSVRLRHSWRIILADILGFVMGFTILGLLVRIVNPTDGFRVHPVLTLLILVIGLLVPFFLAGGFLGLFQGNLATIAKARESELKEDAAVYILPSKWQTVVVAVIGVGISLVAVNLLGSISSFLKINPGHLQSQFVPVTVGVRWTEPEVYTGVGDFPDEDQETAIFIGADQVSHQAWCGPDGVVHYQKGDSAANAVAEEISFPGCTGLPALVLDSNGQVHLVWHTDEIRDTNAVNRQDNLLVESIRTGSGWSEATIIARTGGPVPLSLTIDTEETIHLVWKDADQNLLTAVQDNYQCDSSDLTYLESAGVQAVQKRNIRKDGAEFPFCHNQYVRIQFTPNPNSDFSDQPPTPDGAFDLISNMALTARYEVLFTTMEYDSNADHQPSPGNVLAERVADLYNKVKANPEDYPRGMTVRILLGNYPVMSNFVWGEQIVDAITDIREAGVESMVDPDIGWRLEVANYPGTYPHSHTKFLVVDGKSVTSAGYNFGYLHFPKDHPSGLGDDLFDLGLQITGPVAQEAVSAFDDLWSDANQVHCEDFNPPDGQNWQDTCVALTAKVDHVPEVVRTYLPENGEDHAFSLYRNIELKEADTFVAASLASAEETIDLLHVNFSLELICMANLIFPGICTIDNALPWMDAMLDAMETNHVRVRVIMETRNSNGLENRVAGNVLLDELERRGLEDLVELRFFDGRLHAKSTLIDDKLLIIGSQNMHYSSWGESGLAEYVIATDSSEAISDYRALFETKWAEAIPFDELEFGVEPKATP